MNIFDQKFEIRKEHIPSYTKEALVYVHDTLELCSTIAESIFGDNYTPDHVFTIYQLVDQYRAEIQHKAEKEAQ